MNKEMFKVFIGLIFGIILFICVFSFSLKTEENPSQEGTFFQDLEKVCSEKKHQEFCIEAQRALDLLSKYIQERLKNK